MWGSPGGPTVWNTLWRICEADDNGQGPIPAHSRPKLPNILRHNDAIWRERHLTVGVGVQREPAFCVGLLVAMPTRLECQLAGGTALSWGALSLRYCPTKEQLIPQADPTPSLPPPVPRPAQGWWGVLQAPHGCPSREAGQFGKTAWVARPFLYVDPAFGRLDRAIS